MNAPLRGRDMNKAFRTGMSLVFGISAVFAVTTGAARPAHADTITPAITVTSNAFPGQTNMFAIQTDDQSDMTAFGYCLGGAPRMYTLETLRSGAVLFHNDNPSLDVIKMQLDGGFTGQDGGQVHLEYLETAIRPHTYSDFPIELVRNGSSWVSYAITNGQRADQPFGSLEFVGNYSRLLRRIIGISYVVAR